MGSIPLVALGAGQGVHAPPSPLAQQQQVAALGAAQQEKQIRGLQIQQAQRDMQDQQTLQDLQKQFVKKDESGKPIGYDWDGLMSAAQGKIQPKNLFQLQTQQATMRQSLATANKDELANQENVNGQLYQRAEGLKGITDPTERNQHYQQTAMWAQQHGVNVGQWPAQAPDNDHLTGLESEFGMHAQALKDQQTQAETAASGAKAAADTAKAGADIAQTGLYKAQAGETAAKQKQIEQQTVFGPQGEAADAKYSDILGRLRTKQAVTPQELQWAQGYELGHKKTTTSSDSLGVTSSNTSGPSGLGAAQRISAPQGGGAAGGGAGVGAPNAKQALVDEVGQYKLNPQMLTRLVVKHPDILGMIQQKYPDFDQTTYGAKNKLIQGYTSGPQSKEINAINTVASHLSILNDATDALNNTRIPILNAIANKLGIAVGDTPQTTYRTIVHRVGPEITAAYVQGGGGEGERYANANDFSENNAPAQLKNNIAITEKLLGGKIGALENQYKNTVGRDDFRQRFITPEAQRAFSSLGTQASGGQGAATRTYQGHTYAQQADGTWKLQ